MARLTVQGNRQTAISPAISSAQTIRFPLREIQGQAVIGSKYSHVAAIHVLVNMPVDVATGQATNIAGANVFNLLSVSLQRDKSDPSTTMIPAIPGDLLWLVAQDMRSGYNPIAPPANIPLNTSGSTVHNSLSFVLPIYFEDPAAEDPEDRMFPLASFANGELAVTFNPIATVSGNGNLSYGTTTPFTVDYELVLVQKDAPQIGQDVRLEMVLDPGNSNGNSPAIVFDQGTMLRIFYMPSVWDGNNGLGDFMSTKIASIDSINGGQPLAFPQRSGAQMINDWYERGHQALAAVSGSLLGTGRALELKGVMPRSTLWNEVFAAGQPFKLGVTMIVGQTMNGPHRFLLLKLYSPNATQDAKTAAAAGLTGSVTAMAATSNGVNPATISDKRQRYLPRKLVPKAAATAAAKKGS